MKKHFLIPYMAVMAVLLSSCAKDAIMSENTDSGINFKVTTQIPTRATVTTTANIGSFNVTALGNSANYFTDMSVAVTSAGVCTPAKTYYWPAYELGFYAYANANGGTASITSSAKGIAGVTPAAAAASQTDFVVAYNTGTKASSMASGVALNFRHAFSQIVVRAANKSTAGLKIYVNGIKAGNIKTSGDFTYPAAVTNPHNGGTLARSLWDVSGASLGDYTVSGSASLMPSTAADMMFAGTSWMLVPQQLTAWDLANDKTNTGNGSYLALNVRILDAADNQLYPATAGEYAYANVPIDTEWEPGKRYTYTLNFLDEATGGGAGVDDNGDPVLGNPIKFTLTVDDWDDASAINMDMPQGIAATPDNFVDLGIRLNGNKVLYATYNLGASSPEESGDFFAWGETAKRYSSLSTVQYDSDNDYYYRDITGATYEISNAPYQSGTEIVGGNTKYKFTKYSTSPTHATSGTPDYKITLDAADDAANVILGDGWQIPTALQLEALIGDQTTHELVADYNGTGIGGLVVRGKGSYSSNNIFLPYTGCAYDNEIGDTECAVAYWSNTLSYNDNLYAKVLVIYNGKYDSGVSLVEINENERHAGLPIRPVKLVPDPDYVANSLIAGTDYTLTAKSGCSTIVVGNNIDNAYGGYKLSIGLLNTNSLLIELVDSDQTQSVETGELTIKVGDDQKNYQIINSDTDIEIYHTLNADIINGYGPKLRLTDLETGATAEYQLIVNMSTTA